MRMRSAWSPVALVLAAACGPGGRAPGTAPLQPAYLDTVLRLEARVSDLVGRLTLEEKAGQLQYDAPAIPRLGIPAYNWWSEGLHGVARAGRATVFPEPIGLAATFDSALVERIATVIGTEARAKYHEATRQGRHGMYEGLTLFAPNINIVRDPRWGRGMETFGEDPFLTGRLAAAFVRGLQGDDPRWLRAIATPKHFAVHSGPEPERHRFDAVVDERDLRTTYLPAFEAAVVQGGAGSVMCAYNRVGGEPACANARLLTDILRGEWRFGGYVVSDCWAVSDIHQFHHVAADEVEAAAMSLRAGTDLTCGPEYRSLPDAVRRGLVTEAQVDTAVTRLFRTRFRLGMFDPPERVPYASTPLSALAAPEHGVLALESARRSIVLLKNEGGLLPLRTTARTIAVIGPDADDADLLLGNYSGRPDSVVTPLEGIRRAVGTARVIYARGSDIAPGVPALDSAQGSRLLEEAVDAARRADVAVLFLGLSPRLEGEEMPVAIPGFDGGDRVSLDLPAPQDTLLRAVAATGTPVVLVLLSGSALAVTWAADHVPAIMEAWYPGQEAGTAIADILFGRVSPSGRLPVTFYRSVSDLPPFPDYRMAGRTYRYFRGDPLFPFGHGLSYARFGYRRLRLPARVIAGNGFTVSVEVRNEGTVRAAEVVQLYLARGDTAGTEPIRSLAGTRRITLRPGERQRVSFAVAPRQLAVVTDDGRSVVEPGAVTVAVGGKQPGQHGLGDAATTEVVSGRVEVVGPASR